MHSLYPDGFLHLVWHTRTQTDTFVFLLVNVMQQLLQEEISLIYNKRQGRFLLQRENQIIEQTVCEFLHTISFLVGKDLEKHLLNTDTCFDTIRIPLTAAGESATLDLHKFIRFRNTYFHQMFLLKLEDLLMRKGIKHSSLF